MLTAQREVTFGGTEYGYILRHTAGDPPQIIPYPSYGSGYKLKPTDKICVEANGNIFIPLLTQDMKLCTEISETVKLYELISVAEVKAKIALQQPSSSE